MAEKGRARQCRRPVRHLLAATLAGLPDRFCGPYATYLSSCDLTGAPAASAPPAGTRGASGISGFVYPGCNKAFKESTGLRRHYGCCQLHQVYLCPAEDCEYYASRLGLLNEHFRATHTPTLPHCQRWDEMVERGAGPCLSANQGLLRRKSL